MCSFFIDMIDVDGIYESMLSDREAFVVLVENVQGT